MQNTFKVYEKDGSIFLKPDFSESDLNDWEEQVFKHQIPHFKDGPLEIGDDEYLYNPPESITFLELYDRYKKKEDIRIGPKPERFNIR